jgi:hypothetical protein
MKLLRFTFLAVAWFGIVNMFGAVLLGFYDIFATAYNLPIFLEHEARLCALFFGHMFGGLALMVTGFCLYDKATK